MESRLIGSVVGCLQRLGSAAASVRCPLFVPLDGGVARSIFSEFLSGDLPRRTPHDSAQCCLPCRRVKISFGYTSAFAAKHALRRKFSLLAFSDTI